MDGMNAGDADPAEWRSTSIPEIEHLERALTCGALNEAVESFKKLRETLLQRLLSERGEGPSKAKKAATVTFANPLTSIKRGPDYLKQVADGGAGGDQEHPEPGCPTPEVMAIAPSNIGEPDAPEGMEKCPICGKLFPDGEVSEHLDICLHERSRKKSKKKPPSGSTWVGTFLSFGDRDGDGDGLGV